MAVLLPKGWYVDMNDTEPDYYENNADASIAVTGYSTYGCVAIFDGREDEGVFLQSREEALYVRDALDRWLNEGGNGGNDG